MKPDLQPQGSFPPTAKSQAPSAAPETSTQKQSTNCTNSTNSPIGEIREISGQAPKISVIVPVYKVEKYLPECIESVLAQTFTDFELILVDDGSPDNSGAICDAYAARDPRIRVFHKQNGGVSSARRLGVEQSRGEWISFVDGDDKLLPNALSYLLRECQKSPRIDLVEAAFTREEAKISQPCSVRSEPILSQGLEYALKVASHKTVWTTSPGAKLIRKRSILSSDALNVPQWIHRGEDMIMCLLLASALRVTVYLPTIVYYYRRNTESVTGKNEQLPKDYLVRRLQFLESRLSDLKSAAWLDVWAELAKRDFIFMFLKTKEFDPKSEYIKKIIKTLTRKDIKKTAGLKICLRTASSGKTNLIFFRIVLNAILSIRNQVRKQLNAIRKKTRNILK